MLIGQRLKQFRLGAGYSQQILADKLNVSRQVISKWETDKSVPDLNLLVGLAQLYNVSLNELLDVETVTKPGSLLTRLRQHWHLSETAEMVPLSDLGRLIQKPERYYVDLRQQFSETVTNVAVISGGQIMPAHWRQTRTPYLITLAPHQISVKQTDYLKVMPAKMVKKMATTAIRAVHYAVLQTAGPAAGIGGLPGIGHAYRAIVTIDTKQAVTPYYIANQDFYQLAKVLKAYAQEEHIQFDDQMGLLPFFMAHDTPACYDYLEAHYSELAKKVGFPTASLGQAVYRW
ncbi:XRE family transcriptional regulator [Latilactobacillus sakei]|nr:helix-turn-helix transcriptional regulator [Latilactobacillus sakei]AUX12235.1 XRE family transcriptional regulator [Latilactobacillus sakei]